MTKLKSPSNEQIKAALGDQADDKIVIKLKQFIEQCGGVNAAQKAIDMLDELQEAA